MFLGSVIRHKVLDIITSHFSQYLDTLKWGIWGGFQSFQKLQLSYTDRQPDVQQHFGAMQKVQFCLLSGSVRRKLDLYGLWYISNNPVVFANTAFSWVSVLVNITEALRLRILYFSLWHKLGSTSNFQNDSFSFRHGSIYLIALGSRHAHCW